MLITSFYAGLLALIFLALSVKVVGERKKQGIACGDGGVDSLRLAIRAHGNFAEYTAIFLILLALAESSATSRYILHALAIVFLLGRLLHAYALLYSERYEGTKLVSSPRCRIAGMVLTFTALFVVAVLLIIKSVGYWLG